MYAQPTLVIPVLVRKYVAWTERNIREECLQMQIRDLAAWDHAPEVPDGIEVLPLPKCGSEWLLRRVHNECNWDSPGFRPAKVVHILALRSAPYHDPGGIILARAGKRYVGFSIGRCRSGGRGLVNGLAVHPDFRRQGIGRALLRTAIGYLKQHEMTEATIRVHPENDSALQLYYGEGFTRL
jgi:ribosomal protein S18 acetylase RimI-like enzyme